MNITRCDVECVHTLSLVLTNCLLIKLVRNLKIVPRKLKVQMESITRVRAEIDTIKNIGRSANIVQRSRFWRIQKPTGTFEIKCYKIAPSLIAQGKRRVLADGSKRAVGSSETAGGPGQTQ